MSTLLQNSWSAAADAADALGLVPQPEVVIRLADHLYRAAKLSKASAVLCALPSALARKVENVTRIDPL